MGNNAAFSAFEDSVLACYNKGVLDKELLNALAKPYRDGDTDSGGFSGTLSKKDRLDLIDIVIKVSGKTPPIQPKLPRDHLKWTDAQMRENDEWQDKRWNMFSKIVRF